MNIVDSSRSKKQVTLSFVTFSYQESTANCHTSESRHCVCRVPHLDGLGHNHPLCVCHKRPMPFNERVSLWLKNGPTP